MTLARGGVARARQSRDLVVSESFEIVKDDTHAQVRGQAKNRRLNTLLVLSHGECALWVF